MTQALQKTPGCIWTMLSQAYSSRFISWPVFNTEVRLRTGGNPSSGDVRARWLGLFGHIARAEPSTNYASAHIGLTVFGCLGHKSLINTLYCIIFGWHCGASHWVLDLPVRGYGFDFWSRCSCVTTLCWQLRATETQISATLWACVARQKRCSTLLYVCVTYFWMLYCCASLLSSSPRRCLLSVSWAHERLRCWTSVSWRARTPAHRTRGRWLVGTSFLYSTSPSRCHCAFPRPRGTPSSLAERHSSDAAAPTSPVHGVCCRAGPYRFQQYDAVGCINMSSNK